MHACPRPILHMPFLWYRPRCAILYMADCALTVPVLEVCVALWFSEVRSSRVLGLGLVCAYGQNFVWFCEVRKPAWWRRELVYRGISFRVVMHIQLEIQGAKHTASEEDVDERNATMLCCDTQTSYTPAATPTAHSLRPPSTPSCWAGFDANRNRNRCFAGLA